MVRPGFKQTEVGEIPEDWDLRAIGNSFEFKNGLNKEKRYFGYGWPIVNYMDVFSNPSLTKKDIKGKVDVSPEEKRAYSAKSGDVFFTRTSETVDEIGIASTLLEDIAGAVFSGFILRARPKDEFFDWGFQKYCFASKIVRRQIKSTSSYTTRALTNGRLLSNVLVPSPTDKIEQKAIAKALSDVDELIVSLEKLIAKKRDIKTATMQQLLTGKIRLPGFGKGKGYKQTELGEIPEDWDVRKISEFTDCTAGGTPSTAINTYWGGNILWMNSGELHLKRVDDVEARITEIGLKNSSTKLIPRYCVLIGLAGQGKTRGTVAVNNVALCTNQSIAAIFPSENHITDFLFYTLESRYDELRSLSTGDGGRGGLNLTIIRNVEIPFPSKDEQLAIANVIHDIEMELSLLATRLSKTKFIKQGMMQELLTGRTRLVDPTHQVEQERLHGT